MLAGKLKIILLCNQTDVFLKGLGIISPHSCQLPSFLLQRLLCCGGHSFLLLSVLLDHLERYSRHSHYYRGLNHYPQVVYLWRCSLIFYHVTIFSFIYFIGLRISMLSSDLTSLFLYRHTHTYTLTHFFPPLYELGLDLRK